MSTYRLTVEYDGTDFHGWQVQPSVRTVAGTLLDAVHVLSGERPALTAAGRTDAGAHAHGQVAGVSLVSEWDARTLCRALNALLPDDVVVRDAVLEGEGFHARRDARSRTYRYVLVVRECRAPVSRRHAWTVRGPLDIAAMREAGATLVGTHEFGALGSAPAPGGGTVRTVDAVSVDAAAIDGDGKTPRLETVVITVRANAFLRGMMRAIAGALVNVGQGRHDVAWVRALVNGEMERPASLTVAPARGLHQWSVDYGVAA